MGQEGAHRVVTVSPRLIAAAAIVATIGAAYLAGRWHQRTADTAAYQAKELAAVKAARTEEQRRTAEQAEIAKNAKNEAEQARADARAAGDVSERLRARVAELLAKRPTPTGGGTPTQDPDELLTELFRRADARAGSLAADLDASRIAGGACERAYDALNSSFAPPVVKQRPDDRHD